MEESPAAATRPAVEAGPRRRASRSARSRDSNPEARAIAIAPTVSRSARSERTMSSRCPAYTEGRSPARSTRSSAASSASRRTRAAAIQASGWNHHSAKATSQINCESQSKRFTWANSWRSTRRRRSSGQAPALAGTSTTGSRAPAVIATSTSSVKPSRTKRRRPSARLARIYGIAQSSRGGGAARRAAPRTRESPTRRRASASAAIAAQVIATQAMPARRARATMPGCVRESPAAGETLAFSPARTSREAQEGSPVPSLRASQELSPSTWRSPGRTGRSQAGKKKASAGMARAPARPATATRCRVAADALCSASSAIPVTASSAVVFTAMSRTKRPNCRSSASISAPPSSPRR